MKFSYNWIKEYIKLDLKPEEVVKILTLHSFEAELVKKTKKDAILDIDILPNRFADASSHYGIAREIQALLSIVKGKNLKLRKPKLAKNKKTKNSLKIVVKEPSLCPRYAAALITNIKIGPSPKWLKEKLSACGVGSINNIVDITNFVMLELGQPVHAFDFDKIEGPIIIRKAKEKEKIRTIDGIKRILNKDILLIADKKKPIALAGIKGGKEAELDRQTKNILIEVAHFERRQIYLATKQLKLDSDAARRFSAGIDEHLVGEALRRTIYLLENEANGKIVDWADINLCEQGHRKLRLTLNQATKLIGKKITINQAIKYLRALNCQVKQLSGHELMVSAPDYRKDLSISEDLIEEIARLEGYNNLPSRLPYLPLAPVDPQVEEVYQERIRSILKGGGFSEVYNYSLLGESLLKDLGSEKDLWVRLKNPISERFSILRPNLLCGLIVNIKKALRYDKEIRFFEIGKAFQIKQDILKDREHGLINRVVKETNQLSLALSLSGPDDFFELKGMVELILKGLGISNFWFEEKSVNIGQFDKKISAFIRVDNDIIGSLGKISSLVLKRIGIKQEIVGTILDLDKVFQLCKDENEYQVPSKYPAASRDLAILVDKKIRFSQILNIIEALNIGFLQDVDLFDIYQGGRLPKDKKSLAFHIIYQSKSHTLSDKEINKAHKEIEAALEKELDAIIR